MPAGPPDTTSPATETRGTATAPTRGRAVSPVLAIVLLLAIAVALAMVVAPMVYSFAQSTDDEQPHAEFGFSYSEEPAGLTLDSFGEEAAADGEEGLLTIEYERGEPLRADRVRIQTGTESRSLQTADTEAVGEETMRQGGSITIWVERGASVEVIWESADGQQSAILDSFEVPVSDSHHPGVPEGNLDCEWVREHYDGDGLEVQEGEEFAAGDVVHCPTFDEIVDTEISIDGELTLVAPVDTQAEMELERDAHILATPYGEVQTGDEIELSRSRIEGQVTAGAEVELQEGSAIDGDVTAAGSVALQGDSTVGGDVSGDAAVELDGGSAVAASVDAGGDVQIAADSAVGTSVDTTGDVDISGGSSVGDDVDADGGVQLAGSGAVDGDVDSGTALDMDSGSVVAGGVAVSGPAQVDDGSAVDDGIDADGQVSVDGGSDVGDDVVSGAEAEIEGGGSVDGFVDIAGDLDLHDVTVADGLSVGGDFDCEAATIDGQTCEAYKSPVLNVTIEQTTSPLAEGEDLVVETTVTNDGFEGEQDIHLDVDGTTVDSLEIDLDRGEETTDDLVWTTGDGDAAEYAPVVRSDDDVAETQAVVAEGDGPQFGVSIESGEDAIFENETAAFVTEVQNVGDEAGTGDVLVRDFDGTVVDTETVTLDEGDTTTVTGTWNTTTGDADEGAVTVETDLHSVDSELTVREVVYDVENVLPTDGGAGTIEVVVSVDTTDDEADLLVESLQEPDDVHDTATTTVDRDEDEYILVVDDAAHVDRVRATLRDGDEADRDVDSSSW